MITEKQAKTAMDAAMAYCASRTRDGDWDGHYHSDGMKVAVSLDRLRTAGAFTPAQDDGLLERLQQSNYRFIREITGWHNTLVAAETENKTLRDENAALRAAAQDDGEAKRLRDRVRALREMRGKDYSRLRDTEVVNENLCAEINALRRERELLRGLDAKNTALQARVTAAEGTLAEIANLLPPGPKDTTVLRTQGVKAGGAPMGYAQERSSDNGAHAPIRPFYAGPNRGDWASIPKGINPRDAKSPEGC